MAPEPDIDPRWAAMLEKMHALIVATVAGLMTQNLDVTDDVAGREAHRRMHAHLGGKRGTPSDALVDMCTPAEMTKWAGGVTGKIRLSASMAVAAAIDEDPGAGESALANFVHQTLLHAVPHLAGPGWVQVLPTFAQHLASTYAAMCRRSGLAPEKWAKAFAESVHQDHWAFRRD